MKVLERKERKGFAKFRKENKIKESYFALFA